MAINFRDQVRLRNDSLFHMGFHALQVICVEAEHVLDLHGREPLAKICGILV
jgi:hypothetical protein